MQTLAVYPNPFAAFDRHGIPCGVCPRDPEADAGGPGRFVGARVDPKRTEVLQDFAALHTKRYGAKLGALVAKHEIRSPRQKTVYEYMGVASSDPELGAKLAAKDPILVPATKFYKDRLREGALLPADAATAQACKLPAFVPIAEAYARRAPAFGTVEQEAPASDEERTDIASATVEAGGPPVALEAELGGGEAPAAEEPAPEALAPEAPVAEVAAEPTAPKTRKKNEARP